MGHPGEGRPPRRVGRGTAAGTKPDFESKAETDMGTRGFVGFVAEGREVISYNHADSYPAGLGADTLGWLRSANMDVAAKHAPKVRLVDDTIVPTNGDVEALREFYNPHVGGPSERPTWYQLLRGTQGNLGAMIRAGYAKNDAAFACESLHCEWGYLVDFDEKRFEVYEGLQREQHRDGRFADRTPARSGYWPVRLIASWPLDKLPDDDAFYAAVNGDEDKGGA